MERDPSDEDGPGCVWQGLAPEHTGRLWGCWAACICCILPAAVLLGCKEHNSPRKHHTDTARLKSYYPRAWLRGLSGSRSNSRSDRELKSRISPLNNVRAWWEVGKTLYGILLANNWTEPGTSCGLTLPSDLTRSFSPTMRVSNALVYRSSQLTRRENRSVQSAPFIFQILA